VEVSGDNAADFGFQWQGLIGKRGDNTGVVGGTNFGTSGNLLTIDQAQFGGSTTGSAAGIPLGEGLNVGLIRKFAGVYSLASIARILQSQTNTNIVSTPNLITLDNEEAKIIVGSNVPFVTGQFTQTGSAVSNPFQTIERKDVGITLRIRPQIGENGVVRMTIFQESSSLSAQVAPGTSNAGPSTDKRSIESNVVVDDGQIIVLGGLIEDKYTENKSKVPLLGDIPYLGALFRSESRTKTRTNLMVFLRPIVMRDAETANKLSLERYDLIRAMQKDAQPTPSLLIPINESPVLPPQRRLDDSAVPLSVRPSSPGTEPGALAPKPAASAPPAN
ncbi:MAG TPA: type II secretion system protein GspD, partial [Caldimonas sp.]